MEELLKQLLAAELAKVQGAQTQEPVEAKKAETPAEPQAQPQPAIDMAKLAELIKTTVSEEVQKAMPAPQREQGAGRVGVEGSQPKNAQEALSELVAKARTKPEELTAKEKEAVWALTKSVLGNGLVAVAE